MSRLPHRTPLCRLMPDCNDAPLQTQVRCGKSFNEQQNKNVTPDSRIRSAGLPVQAIRIRHFVALRTRELREFPRPQDQVATLLVGGAGYLAMGNISNKACYY